MPDYLLRTILYLTLSFTPHWLCGQQLPGEVRTDSLQQQMENWLIEGNLEEAGILNNHYFDLFNEVGDTSYLALYLSNQGAILYYQGKFEAAIAAWEAYLPLIDTADKPLLKGRILSNLCECHKQLFNYARSYQYCMEAMQDMDDKGDHIGMVSTLSLVVQHWLAMNQVDTAYSFAQKSLELATLYQLPFAIAEAHQMLAKVAVRQQHKAEALRHLEMAAAQYDSLGFQHGHAGSLLDLAAVYLSLERPYLAAEAAQRSLTISGNLDVSEYRGRGFLQLAEAYLQLKLPEIAAIWLDSAQIALHQIPNENLYLLRDYHKITKQLAWAVGDSVLGFEAYHQYVLLVDTIYHLEKNEALQSLQLAYSQQENEAQILHLKSRVSRYATSIVVLTTILIAVLLFSIFFVFRQRSLEKGLQSKINLLEKEMGRLQSQQLIGLLPGNEVDEKHRLSRKTVETYLTSPLNDTDWSILLALTENPNLSNSQLANNLSLSYEGLRSALKKMYRLFQIDESVSNKRVALLAAVMTANNRSTSV